VRTQSPPFAKGAKGRPPEVVSAHQGCATRPGEEFQFVGAHSAVKAAASRRTPSWPKGQKGRDFQGAASLLGMHKERSDGQATRFFHQR